MFNHFDALLERNRWEESRGVPGGENLVGLKFDIFSKFNEIVRIFAEEGGVFEERTDDRNEEAGKSFLGATTVRYDVAGWVMFVGFMGFDKRIR